MTQTQAGGYSVSGPGLDAVYHGAGPALSRAINAATRRGVSDGDVFYVRDVFGRVVAQVGVTVGLDGSYTASVHTTDEYRTAA